MALASSSLQGTCSEVPDTAEKTISDGDCAEAREALRKLAGGLGLVLLCKPREAEARGSAALARESVASCPVVPLATWPGRAHSAFAASSSGCRRGAARCALP